MIPKTIEIGPATIHTYGLVIALAVLVGWYVAKKRAHLYKIDIKIFDSWILAIPLLVGIIGARLYHVLDYWSTYSKEPMMIIQIQNGGLGIWGALIGVFIGFLYVSRVKKIKFSNVLDLAAPSMAVGQAIGRIGNWVNQEGFGQPTNMPWKVYIDPQNRPSQYLLAPYFHPTFFYEAALNLFIFITLMYFSKRLKKPGQIFALYLILYGTVRFSLEFYRMDTWQFANIKVAQLLSIIAVSLGLFQLKGKKKVDIC